MKWLRNLLNRPAAPASVTAVPASAERVPAPQAGDPPETWVTAICAASDKSQALAWLTQLKDEHALAEVAIRARSGETRFAAVQRVETGAMLERVAQASRDKDKRVYRHCTDVLKKRQQADKSARRAEEISAELHHLLAAAPLPNTRLLDLNKELNSLIDAGEAGLACTALMHQALAQLHQESEALRDLQAQFKAAAELAVECSRADWPWHASLADWQSRFDPLHQACTGLPHWLAEQAVARKLTAALVEIESRLGSLAADGECGRACEDFLAACESADVPAADSATAWAGLPKPENALLRAALEARWQGLNVSAPVEIAVQAVSVTVDAPVIEPSPTPTPTSSPRPRRQVDQDAVRALLDQLEQAIAQGHLVDADAAAKQIKACLGGNSLHGALESRLHRLQAELETLRGWARWGTAQAREKLIEAARELLSGEREVAALALAIAALREEWKRLNAHAAASKAQWESFDAVLEQAYLPVAAQRAEQALRQAEARATREALCAEWEVELAGMDWPQADFKRVEARRAELIKLWRAAPQVSFRDERALRKRFDTLIGSIDQHLDAARSAEYQRREQLIAAAEALHAQADLRLAMSEAKALQQRWTRQDSPVRLKRGDEQKQWQRFRAACNPVFERLDTQRAVQTAQRQEQQQARQNLLDAFAASLEGADADTVKRALTQFRTAWDAARPAAREAADRLETRARDLQQQAQQCLDQVRQDQHRARFNLLARKAALAQRVEAAALSGGMLEAVLAEAKQAWDEVERLPNPVEQLLAQRFATAHLATNAELAAGHATREALLLDLEISLGLPSPAYVADVRRERQLSRLQNRFGTAADERLEPEALLIRCYATAALPDAVCEQRLAAVVQKLVQQGESVAA